MTAAPMLAYLVTYSFTDPAAQSVSFAVFMSVLMAIPGLNLLITILGLATAGPLLHVYTYSLIGWGAVGFVVWIVTRSGQPDP